MKALPFLLAIGCLAVSTAQARTVVLTSNDAITGVEINAAIDTATNFGQEPGKVVFDGQGRGFSCGVHEDNPDVSKLTFIQYSNLQLVGINGANRGAGICNVVIADAPLENILIDGLKIANFIEEGIGISAAGFTPRKNVTIRNNDITGAAAIQANNPVGWKIYNNTVGRSRDWVIGLFGAQDSEVSGNTIDGQPGIFLHASPTQDATGNRIIANRFSVGVGVQMQEGASRNIVSLNTGDCPVVVLGAGTTQNKVLFNWSPTASCGGGSAVVDLGSNNKVVGNKP